MKLFVQALPLLLVGAVAAHSACSDSGISGDTTTVNVTTEPIQPEACNGGRPDGYCNALGAVPETCDCFDCVDTAYCNGTCKDDGQCGGDEDCTCADCFLPGCMPPDPVTNDTGPGAGPSNGGGGNPATTTGGGNGGSPTTNTTTATTGGAPGVGGAGGVGGP